MAGRTAESASSRAVAAATNECARPRSRGQTRCYNVPVRAPDLVMSEQLLIRLHAEGDVTWLVQDAQGRPLSVANRGVPPPATSARARRIVALVPAEDVVLLETDAVTTRRAQLARAIPFALEDQLASPVEDLHFALPEQIAGKRVSVAVVARATMRRWLGALSDLGLRADALVPETLALPPRANGAVATLEPTRALLRSGNCACACESDALPAWLALLAPAAIEVFDFRQAPRLALPNANLSYHERQPDALAFFAANLAAEPALNLLQGEFAPSHRHAPARRLWRRAASLAAAAIVLAFAYAFADYLRLARESERLEAAQHDVLRTSVPELASVAGDPRQLMQSALTRLHGDSGGNGLLALLARIGPAFAGTTRIALKAVEYRNATLELAMRAPDVPTLDLTREQLTNLSGLKAEVTAATTGDKGVDGRVRIGGVKP